MTDNNRDAVLARWQEAKINADKWAAYERQLRDYIALHAFGHNVEENKLLPDGTHRVDLGNGRSLKLVAKTNYTLDREATQHSAIVIRQMPDGPALLNKLIRYKPELIVSEYHHAVPDVKRLLVPAITTKPAAPELKIEEPKS